MGHARCGVLPDTRPWRVVVGHLADGDSAAVVAQATAQAAVAGLELARRDRGLARVVFLLARTALAARGENFSAALAPLDVRVPDPPNLYDLTGGLAAAVHRWHADTRVPRTDVSILGEDAAGEAVVRCVGDRSRSLFPMPADVTRSFRGFSTAKGYSTLAHEFFTRFTQRFLHYHLDRELSNHVGGNGRFPDRADRRAFARDLETHCREAAEVTRRYARDWYATANFTAGITEAQARTFTRACLNKLRDGLLIRGGP